MDLIDPRELDDIERDLADVQLALTRLDGGTYWTCEVSGRRIADEMLERNPVLRSLPMEAPPLFPTP
jgi:RNA polymerase-binding transcription factor DksA